MKRFSQKTGFNSLAELNVTPLLDLAFVLLIIFVITTPLLEQGINVALPSSAPSNLTVDPSTVKTIAIDQEGGVYLDNITIRMEELQGTLEKMHLQNPKLVIGIRADKQVSYAKVVAVLDALQQAGITQFGLITKVDETR